MHPTPLTRQTVATIAAATVMTVGASALIAIPAPVDAGPRSVIVHPGESIQTAIDQAAPNTTIVVSGGVHAEQLIITTDGIELIGRGARLVAPEAAAPNACSRLAGPKVDEGPPTEAGICVVGQDVTFEPFETEHAAVEHVGRPVRNVRIEGFDITGFTGPHVAVVGGKGVRIAGNDFTDPITYAVLSDGSRDTRITDNRIAGPNQLGFIGVCVDDIASPVVAGNDISGQIIGVCVQTTGAKIVANQVHDGCLGMYVDPGVGAVITRNHIFDNTQCGDMTGLEYGRGVTLAGAQGTVLSHNVIEGHTAADQLPAVRLTDDVGEGNPGTGTVATGNVLTHNRITDNTTDLVSTATGTNRIAHNTCRSSVPAGLCD